MNRHEEEFITRYAPQMNESLKRIANSLEKLVKIHGEHMKVSVYNDNGSWTGNKENGWYEKETNTKD